MIAPLTFEDVSMHTMEVDATENIVAGIIALREALASDLDEMEQRLHEAGQTLIINSESEPGELPEVFQRARTGLLSGLASVDEVLAWVRVYAPKDSEGNELECVRLLPRVDVSPMS
jgi:hypothetical protein